ncbi:MAG: TatD DNase family protein, partial [Actinomycetota bacterium]|nr:TatD DNase family protein [Actinomycetota bacterium]
MSQERPPLPEPLTVEVADSHCHLDLAPGEDGDGALSVELALELAASVGVPRIVQIGCDLAGARWAVATAHEHPAIVAGVSLHPNEAPRLAANGPTALDEALAEIDRLAATDRVRAVGETGLDYYRTGDDGRAAQHASFRAHIEMAKRHAKALVIHDRDAHEDVLAVLADAGPPD